MEKPNRKKSPADWQRDIDQSVADYNEWYLRESPKVWAEARGRAVAEAQSAMETFDDFRNLSPDSLKTKPSALFVARMAVSPTMARDRFVEFSGAKKSLGVTRMERDNALPPRAPNIDLLLRRLCDFLVPLFDPELFPWIAGDRSPTPDERDRALLILGERLAGAFYNPVLRNEQEARQKHLMRRFLDRPTAYLNQRTQPLRWNLERLRSDGTSYSREPMELTAISRSIASSLLRRQISRWPVSR